MSTTTDKLALFKYDPSTDGAQTFNIKKALNDNWDKLDDAVKEILITLANKAPTVHADRPRAVRTRSRRKASVPPPAVLGWGKKTWKPLTIAIMLFFLGGMRLIVQPRILRAEMASQAFCV